MGGELFREERGEDAVVKRQHAAETHLNDDDKENPGTVEEHECWDDEDPMKSAAHSMVVRRPKRSDSRPVRSAKPT